jgi:metal-responsive CopG/Arc/MetJ family transcriptional regulator
MNVKTSISLSEATLKAVDQMARARASNRSRVIEEAVRAYVAQRAREQRDQHDLAVLNREADGLNREVEDALAFQHEP